jgi:hypothetical protein
MGHKYGSDIPDYNYMSTEKSFRFPDEVNFDFFL